MKKQTVAIDLTKNIKNRWYLLANRTDAVIYRDGLKGQFVFIHRLSNPTGRIHEGELDSDRPGRNVSSAASGTIHHALDRRFNRHEESAKKFAARIARLLKVSSEQERYDELVPVAEPHFLGLLRAALPTSVKCLVVYEIPREYARGSNQALRRLVTKAAKRDLSKAG